ncbi:hypothetical protein EYC84_004512 [Monilinia fructicola]|uniref:Uncharacterized protein n=1 Tax=Monilinia fructicola TaxID=38448 RepID=A0A5M9K350_MONFR|nr:hypothetical protein EYC84_004512 [Monilinia fructicola]
MKFPSTFIFLPFLATITIQLDSKHGDVDVSTLSPAEYVAALKETINHQYSIIQDLTTFTNALHTSLTTNTPFKARVHQADALLTTNPPPLLPKPASPPSSPIHSPP